MYYAVRLLLLIILWLVPSPLEAATSIEDILIAVRTIIFTDSPPSGKVPLAILFDSNQPQSVADLQTAVDVLDGGTQVGTLMVRAVPLPIDQLDRLSSFRFVLITSSLKDYQKDIFERSKGTGTVTISTDVECVKQGLCVMGVVSEPRVQILLSSSACLAAAVKFLIPFRMMIKEM